VLTVQTLQALNCHMQQSCPCMRILNNGILLLRPKLERTLTWKLQTSTTSTRMASWDKCGLTTLSLLLTSTLMPNHWVLED
jgi:hypothetical protein